MSFLHNFAWTACLLQIRGFFLFFILYVFYWPIFYMIGKNVHYVYFGCIFINTVFGYHQWISAHCPWSQKGWQLILFLVYTLILLQTSEYQWRRIGPMYRLPLLFCVLVNSRPSKWQFYFHEGQKYICCYCPVDYRVMSILFLWATKDGGRDSNC